jgi:hypothetical protein
MKLRLTVDVHYNENNATEEQLRAALLRAASYACGKGWMVGCTDAEIATFSVKVERYEDV